MKNIVCYIVVLVSMSLTVDVHAATTLVYDYDASGNLVRGEGKFYEYNDANQLVRIRHNDASGPVLAEYFYDHNGQRLKKVENGVTTYYIGKHYDTQVAVDGKVKNNTSYYFANGERVAKKDSAGKLTYFHGDHLGSTNAVTDDGGKLVEWTKYYPFGDLREGGSERYTYTGKEKDGLTDWYYYEARFYSPQIKHFTQADTVAPNIYDPQDLNRYAYVRNNPVKYIDPTGHVWWNPFSWFAKSNHSKENKSQATVQLPSTNLLQINESSIRNPLDNMKKGGFDYDKPGLNGVKYAGDGAGGVKDGNHNGIDLMAGKNTPVYAPEYGNIVSAEYKVGAGGYTVKIKGDSGKLYIYAHLKKNPQLDEALVADKAKGSLGVPVDPSKPFSEVGPNYGNEGSGGPHLHFGIMENSKYINPNSMFDIQQ